MMLMPNNILHDLAFYHQSYRQLFLIKSSYLHPFVISHFLSTLHPSNFSISAQSSCCQSTSSVMPAINDRFFNFASSQKRRSKYFKHSCFSKRSTLDNRRCFPWIHSSINRSATMFMWGHPFLTFWLLMNPLE